MISLTEIYNAGHVKYLTPDINDIICKYMYIEVLCKYIHAVSKWNTVNKMAWNGKETREHN